MNEESELYAAVRNSAAGERNYSFVKRTAEYSLKFVRKYLEEKGKGNFSDETKRIAAEFHNALNEITTLIEPQKIQDIKVIEYYAELKEKSKELLERYYKKYQRKIEKGYFPEFVESAKDDLINIYKSYCLSQGIKFDESNPEIITEIEKTVEQIKQKQSGDEER